MHFTKESIHMASKDRKKYSTKSPLGKHKVTTGHHCFYQTRQNEKYLRYEGNANLSYIWFFSLEVMSGLQSTRLHCPWDFPSKNTRVGFSFLLQGIFLTQGLNPGLLHCGQILYHLNHQRKPSVDGECGEGNGNPLQYSCLENPRERGAWWAAVFGVTQSQT